jgi:DNA repair exonuclease SbcCD ATPase subunit
MREDDAYAAEIEDRISTFIGSFKLEVEEEEVAGLLHRLRSDAAEYRRLGKRLQALRDTHYEEQRDGLEKEVRDFLGQYYPEENAEQLSLDAGIQKLSYDAERYRTFASMRSENREAAAPESDREEALRAEMQRFRLIPGQDLRMQIAEISGHRRALATAEEDFARRKAEKEACEQELRAGSLRGRIDASAGGMTASLEELTERYHQRQEKADELAKRIVHLQAEKRALAEKTERLTEAEAELSGRRSEYGELSHRYEVLTRTADYLRKAKLNFSGRYMRPMQESFEKYEELLTGNVSGNFQMDADLNVTVQKDGMSRDVAWLSEGWQDLIGLCRRMSMIEAMYGGEKPFLVLDDPFVNLDGERLERALAFLKKASAEYQILYFSCHESRADALLPQKRSGSAGKHV